MQGAILTTLRPAQDPCASLGVTQMSKQISPAWDMGWPAYIRTQCQIRLAESSWLGGLCWRGRWEKQNGAEQTQWKGQPGEGWSQDLERRLVLTPGPSAVGPNPECMDLYNSTGELLRVPGYEK